MLINNPVYTLRLIDLLDMSTTMEQFNYSDLYAKIEEFLNEIKSDFYKVSEWENFIERFCDRYYMRNLNFDTYLEFKIALKSVLNTLKNQALNMEELHKADFNKFYDFQRKFNRIENGTNSGESFGTNTNSETSESSSIGSNTNTNSETSESSNKGSNKNTNSETSESSNKGSNTNSSEDKSTNSTTNSSYNLYSDTPSSTVNVTNMSSASSNYITNATNDKSTESGTNTSTSKGTNTSTSNGTNTSTSNGINTSTSEETTTRESNASGSSNSSNSGSKSFNGENSTTNSGKFDTEINESVIELRQNYFDYLEKIKAISDDILNFYLDEIEKAQLFSNVLY